jgi:flagellar basal-body rod protein FlgC
MTDISAAISAAASGMRAQTVRMRIAAENIANANSTGVNPNEDPFRRRIRCLKAQPCLRGAWR